MALMSARDGTSETVASTTVNRGHAEGLGKRAGEPGTGFSRGFRGDKFSLNYPLPRVR